MPNAFSRILRWISALAAAVALKWLFDKVLWDPLDGLLARGTMDFEHAELITAVLSYLVPLTLAAGGYAILFGRQAPDDRPVLRKHPWQSPPLIIGTLIIVVALIAGISYGRLFGLPSIALPPAR